MSKKKEELRWINLFIRDMLLVIVVVAINIWTKFRSWWVAFVTGMLVVWISWQFTDYLNHKRLERGIRP